MTTASLKIGLVLCLGIALVSSPVFAHKPSRGSVRKLKIRGVFANTRICLVVPKQRNPGKRGRTCWQSRYALTGTKSSQLVDRRGRLTSTAVNKLLKGVSLEGEHHIRLQAWRSSSSDKRPCVLVGATADNRLIARAIKNNIGRDADLQRAFEVVTGNAAALNYKVPPRKQKAGRPSGSHSFILDVPVRDNRAGSARSGIVAGLFAASGDYGPAPLWQAREVPVSATVGMFEISALGK